MLKIRILPFDGIVADTDSHFCNGGILEAGAALFATVGSTIGAAGAGLGAGIAGATGIGAETAGLIGAGLVDATVGAGLGAAEAGITGGDPGQGALLGGITGGAVGGFGGLAGDALGIGVVGGDALVGAGAGALGAGITGGNPLTGAIGGGISGFAAGELSGGTTPSGASAGGTTAPGASATALAAPSGTPLTDLTAGITSDGSLLQAPSTTPLSSGEGAATDAFGSAITGAGPTATANGSILEGIPGAAPIASGGAAGGTSGAAGGPSTIQTAIDNPSSGNILHALGANAGPLVAGAGLLYSLGGNQTVPGQNEIGQLAGGLQTQGQELSGYLQNGTLPPGAQQGIDQATKAAQAAIRSKYAASGMSGSSAEVQDLNNVTEQAQAQQFQEASTLLKEGLDATSISGQLYAEMMNFDAAQSAQTGAAIASLAGALSGGTTIRIG